MVQEHQRAGFVEVAADGFDFVHLVGHDGFVCVHFD